jgi:tetratricopeptide (TPR) repeat protein
VYEEKGQTEQAIASYEGELAQNPKAYRAAFNLAKLLLKAGQLEKATAYFRKTVDLQPDFGTGQLYLAKALLDGGDLAGAERWARSGLASKPEPSVAPLGHYVLADVYNRRGRGAEALREVAAAKRVPPG